MTTTTSATTGWWWLSLEERPSSLQSRTWKTSCLILCLLAWQIFLILSSSNSYLLASIYSLIFFFYKQFFSSSSIFFSLSTFFSCPSFKQIYVHPCQKLVIEWMIAYFISIFDNDREREKKRDQKIKRKETLNVTREINDIQSYELCVNICSDQMNETKEKKKSPINKIKSACIDNH